MAKLKKKRQKGWSFGNQTVCHGKWSWEKLGGAGTELPDPVASV
jgi:hypothetical protein